MSEFLSCDWGTTHFRLRLVSVEKGYVVAREENKTGIQSCYKAWLTAGRPKTERVSFYRNVIEQSLKKIKKKVDRSLKGIPIIVSGMASSSIGMKEINYKTIPFYFDSNSLVMEQLPADDAFENPVILISGICSGDDVMRGEETKILGCGVKDGNEILILPGTHPKHVYFDKGRLYYFETFLTGEIFDLLNQHSILFAAVDPNASFSEPQNRKSFHTGVERGKVGNILHELFKVRTNFLFERLSAQANYFYLSGLLIGHELKGLSEYRGHHFTIIADGLMNELYLEALEMLKIAECSSIKIVNAEKALVRGQIQCLQLVQNSVRK